MPGIGLQTDSSQAMDTARIPHLSHEDGVPTQTHCNWLQSLKTSVIPWPLNPVLILY